MPASVDSNCRGSRGVAPPRLMRWVILIAPVLIALRADAQQQESTFRRFSLREGLSQSTVNSIVQDRLGFLWFGTQDGLNRFDGYSFKVFRVNPADSTGIADNFIWKILVSHSGELWIGTYNGGLNRFDPATERFTAYTHNPVDTASLGTNNVVAVCEDQRGILWVGTWGAGLSSMDTRYERFTHYRNRPGEFTSLVDNRISAILEDSHGDLWIGTWGGLACLRREDRPAGLFRRFRHDPRDSQSLSNDQVWTLAEDQQGILWVGTWAGGLNRYDRDHNRFTRFVHDPRVPGSITSDIITCLTVDRRGELWIGTANGGLNRMDRGQERFCHVRHDPRDPESLASDGVVSLFEDGNGGFWIGHEGAGISNYDRKRERFMRYRHNPNVPASLSHNLVRSMCEDRNGGLWVATRGGGLSYRKPGTQDFIHYQNNPADRGSLSSNLITTVIQTRNGDILAGSQDRGLNHLVAGRTRFVRYLHNPDDPNSISNNSVEILYEDRAGSVWVGTNGGGLELFDLQTRKFRHFQNTAGDATSLSGNWVRALLEDSKGEFWVGNWGTGLNRFDRPTGQCTRFAHDPADSSSLGNNTVMCIMEDDDRTLWIGTQGGGLNRFDRSTGTFTRHTEQKGLANDVVYGILPDGRGNLWLSTNRGLSRFTPRTVAFRNFDASDGLQSNEFNQGAFCRTRSGMLLFGGIEGLTAFHPDSIVDNNTVPPVVLTSFKIFERPAVLSRAISTVGSVTLQHWENFFSFEFCALDFTAPEKNRYAYMLEGFDGDWVQAGTRRYANYTQLGGGDYVFRVRGSNNDGIWNEAGTSLRVTIIPPLWQTWWFRGIGLMALAVMLFLVYHYRLRRAVEIERMRVRIASDLHDDIGSTLTRIAVQSEIIQTTDDASTIRSASGSIGAASREIITTLSDVVWSIDARNDTLGDLLDRMRDFAAELLGPRSIAVTFDQSGLETKRKIPVDVRQNLYLIFKEAISNVARHSAARHVTISIVSADGELTMTIADDGTGVDKDRMHGGQGLRNMGMRAERIHATLSTDRDHGMRIVLKMKSP